jgi:hypothetical protein
MLRLGVPAYLLYRCGPLILPIIRTHRCDASAKPVDPLVPVEKPGYTPPLDVQGGTITAHSGGPDPNRVKIPGSVPFSVKVGCGIIGVESPEERHR